LTETETLFIQAQRAFEAGQYRVAIDRLTQAQPQAKMGTPLHGEIVLWQVMAHQAAGDLDQAMELCKKAARHADIDTRKAAKNILYVLEAPALQMRPEWMTEIPDLSELEAKDRKNWGRSHNPPPPMPKEKEKSYIPDPVDLTQVEIEDDRLVWGGLLVAAVLVGIVAWVGLISGR
jgi:hypothetical protein